MSNGSMKELAAKNSEGRIIGILLLGCRIDKLVNAHKNIGERTYILLWQGMR